MTLRPEYSLGNSPYNPFLFATVGKERHTSAADGDNGGDKGGDGGGDELSVLSALTRLQVDPWREAARLAGLPPDVASDVLAATLVRLTEIHWATVDATTTARRLIALLPVGAPPEIPTTQELKAKHGSSGRSAKAARPAPALATSNDRPAGMRIPWRASWLTWGVIAAVALLLAFYMKPDNNLEPPITSYTGTQR